MSRRANPTVIGAFVLGAAAIAVLAVLILGGGRIFQQSIRFVMAYDDVAGLQVGAPVMVRGVQVGQVTHIALRYATDRIAVYAEFHPDRVEGTPEGASSQERVVNRVKALVERGLRAQLAPQSFVTGQLYVSLDFHPAMPATYSRIDEKVPEIPTIPTEIALLQDQARRVVSELEKIPLEKLAASAVATIESVGALVQSPGVARAAAALEPTLASVQALARDLGTQVGPAVTSLRAALDEARTAIADVSADAKRLIHDVDRQVEPLATNLASTSDAARHLMTDARGTVKTLDAEIGPLVASVRSAADSARIALESARVTLESARATLERADGVFDESTPLGYELTQALTEFTRAARSLRSLTDELDRQPNVLIFGRGGGQ